MDDKIKNELQKFVQEIQSIKKNSKGISSREEDDDKAYETAVKLSMELINKDILNKDDFDNLYYFVSDSLPWTGEILEIWNSINKQRNR